MEEKKNNQGTEDASKQMIPVRSCILMCLGGAYLIYNGYGLCKNVLKGVDGGGTGFLVVGALFVILGIAMLVYGGRGYMRNEKIKKEEEAREAEQRAECDSDEVEEIAEPVKMSIADRAKLANRLSEEEKDEIEE